MGDCRGVRKRQSRQQAFFTREHILWDVANPISPRGRFNASRAALVRAFPERGKRVTMRFGLTRKNGSRTKPKQDTPQ